MIEAKDFYTATLTAGALLTGFCGTFLQFRIQREAGYYRQVALSYEDREAKDVYVGLSHFTAAFSLIIIATLLAIVFGLVLPLVSLAEIATDTFIVRRLMVAGLLAAAVFLLGYFCAELIHYEILSTTRLANDKAEWRRGWPIAFISGALALIAAATVFRI